jgi:hypothetical protein
VKAQLSRARRVRAQLAGAVDAGRRIVGSVTFEDVTLTLGGSRQVELDLTRNLFDAVEAALDTGREGFALLLDEAQVLRDDTARSGEHPMSMLIAAVNGLQEAGLPLALVVCGLPTLRADLQRARTYSERMFRGENIAELSGNPGPARDAFDLPLAGTGVTVDEALVSRILDEVEGYPYFIQLWGAELWDAASDAGLAMFTAPLLDSIEGDIYARLDEEFYAGRVETLTPSEQDLLLSTAGCPYPPLRTADIRTRSDKSDGNVNVLMGRLPIRASSTGCPRGSTSTPLPSSTSTCSAGRHDPGVRHDARRLRYASRRVLAALQRRDAGRRLRAVTASAAGCRAPARTATFRACRTPLPDQLHPEVAPRRPGGDGEINDVKTPVYKQIAP